MPKQRSGERAERDTQVSGYLGAVSKLGVGRQPENQWTEVLAATLRASPAFLAAFLRACRVRTGNIRQWHVKTQESRRHQGRRDILDLVLWAPSGREVIVEVKRGARLNRPQLKRYSAHEGTLVALTERYPEISKEELRRSGIRVLRWTDLHRLLIGLIVSDWRERFVIEQMPAFLEEAGVAYRPIGPADLAEFHRILKELAAPLGLQRRGVARAFATGQALVVGMAELRQELRSMAPKGSRWSGPEVAAYTLGDEKRIPGTRKSVLVDTDRGIAVGCTIYRGKRWLDVTFDFPLKGRRKRPTLLIGVWDSECEEDIGRPTRHGMDEVMSNGALDWDRVTRLAQRGIERHLRHLSPR